MSYDYKTNTFSFDFDSVQFPIKLSDLIVSYLYPSYQGNCFHPLSLDQFKEILRGEDKTQQACKVLSNLFNVYNGHCEFPPSCFEILSDSVSKSQMVKEFADMKVYSDFHSGECQYEDMIFDFEYIITRTWDGFHNFEELKRGKSTVVLRGHSFKNEDSYMHEACSRYLDVENRLEQERLMKEKIKNEEEIWIEFRMNHKQELKEWLVPIIENPFRFHPCQRIKNSVLNGYPSYSTVRYLDMGICYGCAGRCQFRENPLARGQHSDKWYELGIDKLNITVL